jgi:tetratricopeptide (TPR) repeat protein
MAHAIESRATSPANTLRDALDKAERQVVQLDPANIEDFLVLLDEIEQMFHGLAETQADVRPEEGRWESLLNRLSTSPGPLVNAAARAGGLAQLRKNHPPAESFWWHLDAEIVRRRARSIRRAVIATGSIVAITAFVLWALNFFFPPDPKAVLISNVNSDIGQLILEENWEAALLVVEQAQQTLPDDPELLIWEGVLAEQVGDQVRAQESFGLAQEVLADAPANFWLLVGNRRLEVGNLDGAQQAGEEALALEPENPQATFLLGGVAELRGDNATAIEMFNRTFDQAEADNPQLAVIARVRMGNLLQRVEPFSQSPLTATQTITP